MRFKGLDLNLLVALDVLLEERSVSAAGRRLFLSQSAMSGALARLREHFCDELLIPIGRSMVATPFAEGLVEPLRQLMLQIDATVAPGEAFDPATTRRAFRIGCSDYITEVIISRLVPLAAATAPHATLDIVAPGDDQALALENGEIDLLIVPSVYVSANHPSEPLYDETQVVVAWDGNTSLANGALDEELFRTLGHVVVRFARGRQTSFAESWLDSRLPGRRIELVAPAFGHVSRLVVGTQRIGVMHRRLAEMHAAHLPIRIFDPPFEFPVLTEAVQCHRARMSDGGLRWLRSMLQQCAAGLDTDRPER